MPAGIIALDKLPAGVKEFVGKNYPGYKIINAASDPLCQGGDADRGVEETTTTAFTFLSSSFAGIDTSPSLFSFL